jgi:hypothetical protein
MINRLLKKNSGTRNRRNSGEDCTPETHTGNSTPVKGEVDEKESVEAAAAVPVVDVLVPDPDPDAPPGDNMFLSFSVLTSLPPVAHQPALDGDGDAMMVAKKQQQQQQQQQQESIPQVPAVV